MFKKTLAYTCTVLAGLSEASLSWHDLPDMRLCEGSWIGLFAWDVRTYVGEGKGVCMRACVILPVGTMESGPAQRTLHKVAGQRLHICTVL